LAGNLIYYAPEGNTYVVLNNAFGTSFATVKSNANAALAFTGNTGVNLAFADGAGVGLAFYGSTAVDLAFQGNTGLTLAWTSPTTGRVGIAFRGVSSRFVYYNGNSYSVQGNIYAPYFANISQQQPAWLANTAVAPVPTWTTNTNTRSGYIYYGGSSYTVTTTGVPNVGILPVWTANTVLADPLITYAGTAYLVTGNIYGASFGSTSVQANISTDFTANLYASVFTGISTPAMAWQAANTVVGTQEFISYAGTTYQVKGNLYGGNFNDVAVQANLAFAWNGSTAVTYAFTGNTTGYIYNAGNTYTVTGNIFAPYFSNINVSPWVASNVYSASTYVWFANNSSETYGNTYITTGNAYAPYFANVSTQQPVWLANTVMTPVPTWTASTQFANVSYVYYSGNSYLVSGNVYGTTFADTLVQANVTLSFAGNAPPYIYASGNTYTVNSGANIYAAVFANISANNNPAWQAITPYSAGSLIYYVPEGNTYVVLNNAFGTSFDTVKSNANVALAFTGNTGVTFAWTGNTAVNFAYPGGANVKLAWAGSSTVTFAYSGTSAVSFAFNGNTYSTAQFRLLETKVKSNVLPVLITVGSASNLPDSFDNPNGFDVATFDNANQDLFIAGANAGTYVRSSYIIGKATIEGRITVPQGTTLTTGNVWYNQGIASPSNGKPLYNASTVQAAFIRSTT
jgi:hypothetical protein